MPDEFHHRIRPPHARGPALPAPETASSPGSGSRSPHASAAVLVRVAEIAPCQNRHAQRCEKVRRHAAELRRADPPPVLPRRALPPQTQKLMLSPCSSRHGTLNPVDTCSTPGSAATCVRCIAIKIRHLLPAFAHTIITGKFTASTFAVSNGGSCLLQREQRLHQHARAGQQQERRRDLRHGKQPQPPVAACTPSRVPPLLSQRAPRRRIRRGSRGMNARKTAPTSRQRNAEPHQARSPASARPRAPKSAPHTVPSTATIGHAISSAAQSPRSRTAPGFPPAATAAAPSASLPAPRAPPAPIPAAPSAPAPDSPHSSTQSQTAVPTPQTVPTEIVLARALI